MRFKSVIEDKRSEAINQYFQALNKDSISKDLCSSKLNIKDKRLFTALTKRANYRIEKDHIFSQVENPESPEIINFRRARYQLMK